MTLTLWPQTTLAWAGGGIVFDKQPLLIWLSYSASLATGLPYWERYDVTLGDVSSVTTQGLWTYCIDYAEGTGYTDTCGTYKELGNHF